MASKWLDGLSPKAQGFLIAALLFRSRDCFSLFTFLDADDTDVLKERAMAILDLDRAQRVRILVQELKRQHDRFAQPWILAIHPSWIEALLREETQGVQSIAIAALPSSLRIQLLESLQIKQQKSDWPKGLLLATQKAIEHKFTRMRMVFFDECFTALQLLFMTKEELSYLESKASVEGLAFFLAKEPKNVQKEIAQRLEYTKGQRLLQCIESNVVAEVDLFSVVVQAATTGKIDPRFASYLKPQ